MTELVEEVSRRFWEEFEHNAKGNVAIVVGEFVEEFSENNAYLLQQVLSSRNQNGDGKTPAEFLCGVPEFESCHKDALDLIIDHGGLLTEACYSQLLSLLLDRRRTCCSFDGLKSLVDSGYFPTRIGLEFGLDLLIQSFLPPTTSTITTTTHSDDDEELAGILAKLFAIQKEEAMARHRTFDLGVVGVAYKAGGAFDAWETKHDFFRTHGIESSNSHNNKNTNTKKTNDKDRSIVEIKAPSTEANPLFFQTPKHKGTNKVVITSKKQTPTTTTGNATLSSVTPNTVPMTTRTPAVVGGSRVSKKRSLVTPTPVRKTARHTRNQPAREGLA